MYLPKTASRRQVREAENARQNRLEIAMALRGGQVTRRQLFRWGALTAAGTLAFKNGLHPMAPGAYAQVPTGTPRSPLFGAQKFTQPLPRVGTMTDVPLVDTNDEHESVAWPSPYELPSRRLSYHDAYTKDRRTFINPVTRLGPVEGRPPGEFFAHQRWNEFKPHYGYTLSLGQIKPGCRFAPEFPEIDRNSVWTFGPRAPGTVGNAGGIRTGNAAPTLVRARYGEPFICRIYNDLPNSNALNNGFGHNEASTHLHNAHNGAESDGACNAYHFPGTFYDYHWACALARRDMPQLWLRPGQRGYKARAASGPDDGDGLVDVAGDFREMQSSLWFHDHRFFYTAENVYKGHVALLNLYSGIDRGREGFNDGYNLNLPSGTGRPFGCLDFDVNLAFGNIALNQAGQLFFDIFDRDGFLGDMITVNNAYYPYMEVLPRRYRFRMLNAMVARFMKLVFVSKESDRHGEGEAIQIYLVANDGNLLPSPVKLTTTDEFSPGERFDVIVDFSKFDVGDKIRLVNLMRQVDGRKPDGAFPINAALAGDDDDACVGSIMEFRVVGSLPSVDSERTNTAEDEDKSVDFDSDPDWERGRKRLIEPIPIYAPVRERTFEFVRGSGDARDTPDGQCVPECGDIQEFPWNIKVNGEHWHSLNANRISALITRPGEVEHWTFVNGSDGWDHPVHLHFEEGLTIDRGGFPLSPSENRARKDVWRLGRPGRVKVQVRFGEFGGAYVTHCHNTTHEDFAMLLRMQLLTPKPGQRYDVGSPHYRISPTPIPTPRGVKWMKPEILEEGDPRNPEFFEPPS